MRIRSNVATVLAVAGTLAFLQDAFAQDYPTPSFDCANIMSPQELQICRSQELSELDGRHGSLVERAIRASSDRERTRAEMDAWLERVRNPCQTDSCLVEAYASHIRELEREDIALVLEERLAIIEPFGQRAAEDLEVDERFPGHRTSVANT